MIYGIPLSWIVAGVLALGGGGYVLHCQNVKGAHAELVANLQAAAAEQEMRNEELIEHYTKEKEDADKDAASKLARLQRDLKRMRDERNRAGSVPAAPAASAKPDLACFSRADLERAVGVLEAGMEAIAGEGAACAIELEAARKWAQAL